jgi:hypothetical protein
VPHSSGNTASTNVWIGMVENQPKPQGARAKIGDAISWVAMNLFGFAGLWLVFMIAIGVFAWILFGSRGDPQRTIARHVGEMIFAFLVVGAALLFGSIPYLLLLLGLTRRLLGWRRRVIAVVLSPIVGLTVWLSGAGAVGRLIYGLVFPIFCGLVVRFPDRDTPGHLVFRLPRNPGTRDTGHSAETADRTEASADKFTAIDDCTR